VGLVLTTPPAVEPVTLDEAKAHLRVDTNGDDALIARLIASARERAEAVTGRAFIAQGWTLALDAWPASRTIVLPKPPLVSVASVTLADRAGDASVLDADAYIVDTAAARIVLKSTSALPATLAEANAVAVAFTAGYGADADDVPAAIRQAILAIVAELYEKRGDEAVAMPAQALSLLAPYRVLNL